MGSDVQTPRAMHGPSNSSALVNRGWFFRSSEQSPERCLRRDGDLHPGLRVFQQPANRSVAWLRKSNRLRGSERTFLGSRRCNDEGRKPVPGILRQGTCATTSCAVLHGAADTGAVGAPEQPASAPTDAANKSAGLAPLQPFREPLENLLSFPAAWQGRGRQPSRPGLSRGLCVSSLGGRRDDGLVDGAHSTHSHQKLVENPRQESGRFLAAALSSSVYPVLGPSTGFLEEAPQTGSAEAPADLREPGPAVARKGDGNPVLPPRRGASSRSQPPRGTTARPSELWRQPEGSAAGSSDNPRTLVWLQAFLLCV